MAWRQVQGGEVRGGARAGPVRWVRWVFNTEITEAQRSQRRSGGRGLLQGVGGPCYCGFAAWGMRSGVYGLSSVSVISASKRR